MYDTDDPLDESEDLGQHNEDLEEAGHGDQVESDPAAITIWDFTGRKDSSGNQRESATLFPQDLSLYSRRAVPLFPQGCPFIPAGLSFYSRRTGAAAPGGI